MKRLSFLGVVVVLVVVALRAQAPPPGVDKELLKLENDWYTAYQKQDAAFLEKLFADEYLATSEEGITYTKAEELAILKDISLSSFVRRDMKVRVYGETAVVTGVNILRYSYKGQQSGGTLRFTDVLVRRNGRWQCVATQSTKAAEK